MQLYTIEYDQLTISSTFGANGIVTTAETRVRHKIYDLPLQTMVMYRDMMKALNFVSSAQTEASNKPLRRERRAKILREIAETPAKSTPVKSRQQQINEAAASGDMTAAINMRAK